MSRIFRELSPYEEFALHHILSECGPLSTIRSIAHQYDLFADSGVHFKHLAEGFGFLVEFLGSEYDFEPRSEEVASDANYPLLEKFLESFLYLGLDDNGSCPLLLGILGLLKRYHDYHCDNSPGRARHRPALFASAQKWIDRASIGIAEEWETILRPPFDYRAYLLSPEWQARREERLGAAGRRCQVCNSPRRLDVHHRTYDRIGNESPDDLVVLCRSCHKLFHDNGRLAREPKPFGPGTQDHPPDPRPEPERTAR